MVPTLRTCRRGFRAPDFRRTVRSRIPDSNTTMLAAIYNTFLNCFKIPELKSRLLFTLMVLAICRLEAVVRIPGLDGTVLQTYFASKAGTAGGSLLGMYSLFTGGALEHCAVGALGIMPYISATIIIQLLTAVIPTLSKLAREEGGRTKIIQYGRYLTVLLCLGQGMVMAIGWENPEKLFPQWNTAERLGALHRCSYMVLSPPNAADVDDGNDAADVAGRTDYRTRHRQRRFARHHHRHPSPPAPGGSGPERYVFPRSWCRGQVQLRACHRARAFAGRCDRRRDCHYPGAAEGSSAIRPAGGRPKSVFRRHLVHAAASELLGCYAHHLCPGDSHVSAKDLSDARTKLQREVLHGDRACFERRSHSLHDPLRVDDSFLLVFLGGNPV